MKFLSVLALQPQKDLAQVVGAVVRSTLPAWQILCAGPLHTGAFASDKMWHSEKIRCACKFCLCSVHRGFAGFGAVCLLTLLLARSTQILLKWPHSFQAASPGAPNSHSGGGEGAGGD